MTELSLSTDFLEWLIVKVRSFETEDIAEETEDGAPGRGVPHDRAQDPIRAELAEAIEDLNDRQMNELTALVWLGRASDEGDAPETFEELVGTAASERVNKTSVYLLGMPLLADYLEEGASSLGLELDV